MIDKYFISCLINRNEITSYYEDGEAHYVLNKYNYNGKHSTISEKDFMELADSGILEVSGGNLSNTELHHQIQFGGNKINILEMCVSNLNNHSHLRSIFESELLREKRKLKLNKIEGRR